MGSMVEGVNRDFWRGRSVFVTGHTGFKGGWLATWLVDMGAEVTGYSREPNTTPSYFDLCRLGNRMHSVIGDVLDADALANAMARCQPTVVFHLAAQALVRRSYREPVETFATNILGTVNVLEAIRATPSVASAVIVTSDKCYANHDWSWGYRENEALGGDDPYSASKACAELVTAAYRQSFFKNCQPPKSIATARAGNVIGGGDWSEDRLVPDAIRALQQRQALIVRNPDSVRPWQHVLDPLAGYLNLAEQQSREPLRFADCWNFGPAAEEATTVADVVDRLIKCWGSGEWCRKEAAGRRDEAHTLTLDSSKARRHLQWRPALDLNHCINLTVDWYRALFEPSPDMFAFSCRQIRRYEQMREDSALAIR